MFYDLPNDLQVIVLSFLSLSEIASLASVPKDAKKFSENTLFWKYKLKAELKVSPSGKTKSYKLEYKKQRDEKLKRLVSQINSESLFEILNQNEIISEDIIENYLETYFIEDFLLIVANYKFVVDDFYHAKIDKMIEKVVQNEKLLERFNPHQLYSLIINLHGRELTAVADHLLELIFNNTSLLSIFVSDGNLGKIINYLDVLGDESAIDKLTLVLDAIIKDDELFQKSINSMEALNEICTALSPTQLKSYVEKLQETALRLNLPNSVTDNFDLASVDDDEQPIRKLLFN